MRTVLLFAVMALFCFSAQVSAYELTPQPQAMLYYKFSVGGTGMQRAFSTFGLRVDTVTYSARGVANYDELIHRPAVFDLRMGRRGVEGIYISGIDYFKLYKVNRQNDEQNDADDESGRSAGESVKAVIENIRDTAPMGFYIGAGLGIALLLGG